MYSGWPNTGSSAPYRLSILLMAAMAATSEIWDSRLHSPKGKNRAARLPRGAKLSARRVTDCIRHRYHTDSPAVSTWPSTVATAAPIIPHQNPKMNSGSRITLTRAPARVAVMAKWGLPSERITGFIACPNT